MFLLDESVHGRTNFQRNCIYFNRIKPKVRHSMSVFGITGETASYVQANEQQTKKSFFRMNNEIDRRHIHY